MTNQPPNQAHHRLMVRVSEYARLKLSEAAAASGRSLSSEIALRLEKSFETDDVEADTRAIVEDHETRIADLERRMEDVFHMSGWRDYPENRSD